MNLISITKLSHDLHCKVIFSSSHCELKDQNLGKIIGHAEAWDNLYFLVVSEMSFTAFSTSSLDKIWLHERPSR